MLRLQILLIAVLSLGFGTRILPCCCVCCCRTRTTKWTARYEFSAFLWLLYAGFCSSSSSVIPYLHVSTDVTRTNTQGMAVTSFNFSLRRLRVIQLGITVSSHHRKPWNETNSSFTDVVTHQPASPPTLPGCCRTVALGGFRPSRNGSRRHIGPHASGPAGLAGSVMLCATVCGRYPMRLPALTLE
jgi:hypothetical protein